MSPQLTRYNTAKLHIMDGYQNSLVRIDEMNLSEPEMELAMDLNDTKTIADLASYAACLQAFVESNELQAQYESFRLQLESELLQESLKGTLNTSDTSYLNVFDFTKEEIAKVDAIRERHSQKGAA